MSRSRVWSRLNEGLRGSSRFSRSRSSFDPRRGQPRSENFLPRPRYRGRGEYFLRNFEDFSRLNEGFRGFFKIFEVERGSSRSRLTFVAPSISKPRSRVTIIPSSRSTSVRKFPPRPRYRGRGSQKVPLVPVLRWLATRSISRNLIQVPVYWLTQFLSEYFIIWSNR